MIKKFFVFFCGLLLVPLTLATFYHLPSALSSLGPHWHSIFFLLLGVCAYVLFELIFNRPMRTYVFGHELTHAAASVLMGGKVHSFNVSEKGGSVTLSKTNFLVALAPYCVPIYTIFVLLAYCLLRVWIPAEKMHAVFLASVGVSLAFHFSLTLFAIRQKQPDIQKIGFFFSVVFILLANAWILVAIAKILFWNALSVKAFVLNTMKTQLVVWKVLIKKMLVLYGWIEKRYFISHP